MKILLVSDSYNRYGAEKMLSWVGNILQSNGHEITFCSLFDEQRNDSLDKRAIYVSFRFDKKTPFVIRYLRYFIYGAYRLVRLQAKNHFDYVITFKENPLTVVVLARLFCRIKHVHSERDNPYNRDSVSSRFKMWLYRFADKIVFQTEGARQFFNQKVQSKSVIIPNPVSIPTVRWNGLDEKTLVNVGRLDIRYKRQDVLLNAFCEVLKTHPEYKLNLFGDGDDREQLESMALELGISDKVFFWGKVDNVQERLVNEGIFVMTSDTEGMPNALMEAMAFGMPVISTDCEPGGARVLIDDGVNGLLVPRSAYLILAQSILRIIEDRTYRIKLGKNAREKMSCFDERIISKCWIDYIES